MGDKARSMPRQDLTEESETKWETKPDPCRDKISQGSGKHSGKQIARQSQIQVVTRSHRGVGEIAGDKLGHIVGDKARSRP